MQNNHFIYVKDLIYNKSVNFPSFVGKSINTGVLKAYSEELFSKRKNTVIFVDQNDGNDHWKDCFWSMFNYGTLNLPVFYYESSNFKDRYDVYFL